MLNQMDMPERIAPPISPAPYVAAGFEDVATVFQEHLATGADIGAAVAITVGGEIVVDLWGGHADEAGTCPVDRDSLFAIWSASKGVTATCIALLVEHGKLDHERPVADYWPEFAAEGKGRVTVAEMMSHQAGICGVRTPITIEDYYGHHTVARLLALEKPFFTPGSAWGYHALSIGVLADELVRRVDGRTVAEFFRQELAGPLSLDIFMGLPVAEASRLTETIPPSGDRQYSLQVVPNQEAFDAAVLNPPLAAAWANQRDWQEGGLPAGGIMANARGLARLYALLANGGQLGNVRLLSPDTIAAASLERIDGIDEATGNYRRLSAGYQLATGGRMGPNRSTFGHSGWGGAIAFADPELRLSFAYTPNRMVVDDPRIADERLSRLLTATYRALGVTAPFI
ncbi:serine hydrolase [Sphingomonas naphthae]|uniref:Serine hydrolase n=1 Tax=Sphingomonas naphthae TaxID=1813468 RepID=A0ABY7TNA5_9SPHN|nr:serine hydrolase domain-containing protein [Sphingomonas naphthae]WCT74518.1 serine hydrolase [Sphingomonas naphthae]